MPNQGRWRLPSGRRARTYGAVAAASAVALTMATALAVGGEGSGSAADRSAHASFGGGSAPVIGKVRELPELRTSRSRTVDLGDGTYEVRVSNEPVNFRGRDGRWRAIDNRLRAAVDGTFTTTANPFAVTLPANASQPVTVEHGGRELAFALAGGSAAAEAETDGAAATYDEVVDDVDVSYEARGGSLKETLTLASADVPTSYSFATDAPGLRPRLLRSGGVGFFDAGDRRRFTFAPPWMKDAAGALSRAVRYALVERDGSVVVQLRVDEDWLNDPARRFPVDVDPTVWAAPEGTCQLTSGFAANVDDCGVDGPVWVGRYGSAVHRAVVMVDPRDVVPPGTVLLQGQLDTLNEAQSADEDTTLELFGLTREFGPEATWNEADDGESWTTPGGDVEPAALHRRPVGRTEVGNWIGLALPRLAQAQLDETKPVNGLLVKQADESRQHVNILDTFTLKLRYHWRTGIDDPAYSLDRTELTGSARMDVNVGNGNLFTSSDDLPFGDYEGRLPLRRVWNAQVSGPFDGTYGVPSRGDHTTIALERNWIDDSMILYGPGATDGLFVKRADGSYEPPSGLPATLAPNGDGTWTLTFDDSGEVWRFGTVSGDRYWLESAEDPFGKVISVDYDDATVSDSDGRFERSTVGPDGNIARSIDQGGAVDTYTYDDGDLISYRDPAGAITRYTLDPQERIERIDLPDRRAVELDYDSDWRVTAVTPVATDGRPGTPTTYNYANGVPLRTTRTEPGGRQTVYTFDNGLLATEIAAGATPPALTLSGSLWDARGTTTSAASLALATNAAASGGIAKVELFIDGEPEEEWENDCTSSCGGLTPSWTIDTAEWFDGPHTVRVTATAANGDQRSRAFRFALPDRPGVPEGVVTDSEPDPADYDIDSVAECEAEFGVGAPECTDVEESFAPLVAPGLTVGIAQDGGEYRFLNAPLFEDTGVKQIRRILPYNIGQRIGDPDDRTRRRMIWRFPNMVGRFKELYTRANASGVRILVSFQSGCVTDVAHVNPHDGRGTGECFPDPQGAWRREPYGRCPSNWPLRDLNSDYAPCAREFLDAARTFKQTFRKVSAFTAWNEPNHSEQPTSLEKAGGLGPQYAARYAAVLTKMCAGARNRCTVVAGDFAQRGQNDTSDYTRRYLRAAKAEFRTRGVALPQTWAFHPYVDVKNQRGLGLKRFIGDVKNGLRELRIAPTIWLTEVGSRVDTFDKRVRERNGRGEEITRELIFDHRRNTQAQQAAEVKFLFEKMIPGQRVRRVYYYSFCAPRFTKSDLRTWDSGLIGGWAARDERGRDVDIDLGVCDSADNARTAGVAPQTRRDAYVEFSRHSR